MFLEAFLQYMRVNKVLFYVVQYQHHYSINKTLLFPQCDDLWCVSKKVMSYEAKVENENTPQIMSEIILSRSTFLRAHTAYISKSESFRVGGQNISLGNCFQLFFFVFLIEFIGPVMTIFWRKRRNLILNLIPPKDSTILRKKSIYVGSN